MDSMMTALHPAGMKAHVVDEAVPYAATVAHELATGDTAAIVRSALDGAFLLAALEAEPALTQVCYETVRRLADARPEVGA